MRRIDSAKLKIELTSDASGLLVVGGIEVKARLSDVTPAVAEVPAAEGRPAVAAVPESARPLPREETTLALPDALASQLRQLLDRHLRVGQ